MWLTKLTVKASPSCHPFNTSIWIVSVALHDTRIILCRSSLKSRCLIDKCLNQSPRTIRIVRLYWVISNDQKCKAANERRDKILGISSICPHPVRAVLADVVTESKRHKGRARRRRQFSHLPMGPSWDRRASGREWPARRSVGRWIPTPPSSEPVERNSLINYWVAVSTPFSVVAYLFIGWKISRRTLAHVVENFTQHAGALRGALNDGIKHLLNVVEEIVQILIDLVFLFDSRRIDFAALFLVENELHDGPERRVQVVQSTELHGLVHHLRHESVASEYRRRVGQFAYLVFGEVLDDLNDSLVVGEKSDERLRDFLLVRHHITEQVHCGRRDGLLVDAFYEEIQQFIVVGEWKDVVGDELEIQSKRSERVFAAQPRARWSGAWFFRPWLTRAGQHRVPGRLLNVLKLLFPSCRQSHFPEEQVVSHARGMPKLHDNLVQIISAEWRHCVDFTITRAMCTMRKVVQVELEDVIECRMDGFFAHFRSTRDFTLVRVYGADNGVRIALVVLPRQILTAFQLHLDALVLMVRVGVRNAEKVPRRLLNVVHVIVADDVGDILLAARPRQNRAVCRVKKLWRFVICRGREQGGGCVIVSGRLEVLFAVVVLVVQHFHFYVRHALYLRVVVDRSQGEPVVLVIVQVQVTLSYCYFANSSVLFEMTVTFQNVHR